MDYWAIDFTFVLSPDNINVFSSSCKHSYLPILRLHIKKNTNVECDQPTPETLFWLSPWRSGFFYSTNEDIISRSSIFSSNSFGYLVGRIRDTQKHMHNQVGPNSGWTSVNVLTESIKIDLGCCFPLKAISRGSKSFTSWYCSTQISRG